MDSFFRFIKYLEQYRKILLIIIIFLAIAIFALVFMLLTNKKSQNNSVTNSSSTEISSSQETTIISTSTSTATATPIPKVPDPLTGEMIEQREYDRLASLTMIPIVVENHPDARPQSGLSQAEAVYEYLAEGGITRYLAVFLGNNPTRIGPERSLRTYLAASGSEYHGIVAHHGFTAKRAEGGYAFDPNLIDVPYFDSVNGIRHTECGGYRDQVLVQKVAYEHTLFNTLKDIRDCAGSVKWNTDFVKYKFTSVPDIANSTPAVDIVLDLVKNTPDYAVEWNYDVVSGKYLRKLATKNDVDFNTKSQIAVKNLIIMKIPMLYSNNTLENDVYYKLVGEGKAEYIHDGVSQEVTWKKAGWTDRTLYFDSITGEEVKFQIGNFWYEMMPTNGTTLTGSLVVK